MRPRPRFSDAHPYDEGDAGDRQSDAVMHARFARTKTCWAGWMPFQRITGAAGYFRFRK
jgi:hypothetical protein